MDSDSDQDDHTPPRRRLARSSSAGNQSLQPPRSPAAAVSVKKPQSRGDNKTDEGIISSLKPPPRSRKSSASTSGSHQDTCSSHDDVESITRHDQGHELVNNSAAAGMLQGAHGNNQTDDPHSLNEHAARVSEQGGITAPSLDDDTLRMDGSCIQDEEECTATLRSGFATKSVQEEETTGPFKGSEQVLSDCLQEEQRTVTTRETADEIVILGIPKNSMLFVMRN